MKAISLRTLFVTIILILTTGILNAQKIWTLEECINYALEHNINIQRQEIRAQQAENNHRQSKFELLPNLNGGIYHMYRAGKSVNLDNYEYVNQQYQYGYMGISSNLPIFDGLELQNRIKRTKYDLLSQLESIEEAKYNVTMNIVTYYLNVLSNQEQRTIREDQLEVTLEQIEQTKQQVEVGNKAKGDLLEIQAQAARERVQLTDAKNQLRMAKINLIQLMNLDSLEGFDIETPEDLKVEDSEALLSTKTVYNESIKEFPTIKMAEYQLKSSEKYLDMMKGRRYPELSLGVQTQTRYNELSREIFTYSQQIKDNAFVIVELSLSLPIFNRMTVQNQISNARLSVKDSKKQLQEYEQNLFKDIQRARNEAISSYETYQSNKEAVKSMEEAFNYTKERYDVGLVDVIEYQIAKNNLSKARSDLANAKYNYIFRLKLLEFFMGQQMKM